MGIGTMSRGEKAVIYVTSKYLTQCSFMPSIEGTEEVHFEVELVHFIQVRKVILCCKLKSSVVSYVVHPLEILQLIVLISLFLFF